jgi:hypothetical protein
VTSGGFQRLNALAERAESVGWKLDAMASRFAGIGIEGPASMLANYAGALEQLAADIRKTAGDEVDAELKQAQASADGMVSFIAGLVGKEKEL